MVELIQASHRKKCFEKTKKSKTVAAHQCHKHMTSSRKINCAIHFMAD
jgi:hypothetical protein